jgi:CRP-like cAMP-binding protein
MSQPHGQLATLQMFKGFSAPEFASLISKFTTQTIETGMQICKDGAAGDSLFLLSEGEVRISKEVSGKTEEELARIKAPGTFGMVSLIDGGERSATCTTLVNSTILVLTKNTYDALLAANDIAAGKLLFNLTQTMSEQLRMANQKIQELYSHPLETIERLKGAYKAILSGLEEAGR